VSTPLDVRDSGAELLPDAARVVADLFLPGESTPGASSRTEGVVERVLAAPRAELEAAAALIEREFDPRHTELDAVLTANADKVNAAEDHIDALTAVVLGATFTAEYAIEGAALCNPSAVADPDQSGVPAGQLRVVVSMRSIGEGHVSAISFCTALIGADRSWTFGERALPLARPTVSEGEWELDHLRCSLEHDGQMSEVSHAVMLKLPARSRKSDIDAAIRSLPDEFFTRYDSRAKVEAIRVVARSAYDADFAAESILSQRVLLPIADEERHGMEDARFVRFVDDDGSVEYRASYTAYDGRAINSRLIVTTDFREFSIRRLTGSPARTKGMAFFPRRVGGRLLALTRSGGESISLATSDNCLDWTDETLVYAPELLWEVVQSGNCGSPIETDRGWLVLTHGVGPMRRYAIGALLLDLDDPTKVLARLETPLIEPDGELQDGYVPHVVYSCGGIVHDGILWVPYGVGDSRIRVASVPMTELLDAMTPIPLNGRTPPPK